MMNKNNLRVIISGGGTGGHIFPAIAIANAIVKKRPDTEILFVGAEGRMEMEKVPAAGYRIVGLWISGLQRKLSWRNLLFPVKVIHSIWKARKIIREFNPDVVVGVGGYASGPTLYAATQLKLPALIQEQNSFPGITNKLLANKVTKICVAYDQMDRFFNPEKIVFTGNPVRENVVDIDGKKVEACHFFHLNPERKTVLVVGGSLGARTINESIANYVDLFVDNNIQVIWQTGKFYINIAKQVTEGKGNMHAVAFINEMDLAYAAADIVVSRAGAIAISELCLVKKPVILIPSPNVAEDHQTKNAMALVQKNAAVMIKDVDARICLGEEILTLLNDQNKRRVMCENIASLGKVNASSEIAEEVFKMIRL